MYGPAFINEMSPLEMLGVLGGISQFMCTLGIMIPSIMAVGIPGGITDHADRSYENDFLVSEYWRVLVLAPILVSVI